MKRGIAFAAALAVCSAAAQPIITEEPQSRAAAEGRRVSFRVQAQGSGPLRYQWQLNGQNIPRAVHPSYGFTATLSRAGTYTVLVQDASGATRLASANLEVQKRPVIRSQPKSQVVGAHQTAVFEVTMNESGPYSYVNWWHHSSAEPHHEIPVGAAQGVRTLRLEIPDATDNGTFNGLYWIRVTNLVGGTISRRASLTVVGPPQFTSEPQDKSVKAGRSTTFAVSIAPDAGGRKTAQWFFNGNAIPGANSRILRLSRVQPADAGFYHCVVSGIGGSATTYAARLTVY
jgi:membrane carboxypeptidase/penicillin-binding protein PbpC